MASTNSNQTVDSTGLDIFDQADDGGPCTEFQVAVKSSASFPVLVNIPGLHVLGEFFPIPIGISQTFKNSQQGEVDSFIQTVEAKGDGGDTILDYGVISKQEIVR